LYGVRRAVGDFGEPMRRVFGEVLKEDEGRGR